MPRSNTAGISVLLTIGLSLCVQSLGTSEEQAAPKDCSCPRLSKAPELDGDVLADPVWQGLPVLEGFSDLRTGLPSARQTSFRMGYTSEALFLGIVCLEPKPDTIRADLPDGGEFHDEDSVMVFLGPSDQEFLSPDREPRLVFDVNAIGSRASRRTIRKWQAVSYIDENAWSVEIVLPWDVIGSFPAEGKSWRFNICRRLPAQPFAEYSTWANLEYAMSEAEHLGTIRFEDVQPDLFKEIETRRQDQGGEVLVYSRPDVGVLVQSEFSERRAVYSQGPYVAPRLSPDRGRILFNSVEGGQMGVWLVDPSGDHKERLCEGVQGAWSPDGARVVFQRDGCLIERVLASGEENVVSPEDAPRLAFPSYVSASGIPGANPGAGFLCTDEAGNRVYLLPANREKPLEVLLEGEIGSAPRCSADGTTLAYQNGAHIYLMDLQTRTTRQLTLEPGVQACPVWADDGRSLCYVRAPFPFAEEWDICQVEIANPSTANLIAPRVHPGFDWRGSLVQPARATSALGMRLALWRGQNKLEPGRSPDPQAGWELLPERSSAGPLEGAVVVENDWLYLHISREGAYLIPKTKDLLARWMAVEVSGSDGKPANEAAEVRLVTNDGDNVILTGSFLTGDGGRIAATFRVPRSSPYIETRVENGAGGVGLRADMARVIAPDRFANDLVLDPAQVALGATVSLPRGPFVLGCVAGSDSIVMLAARSATPSFTLTTSEDGGRFTTLTAAPEANCVALAILTGARMWQEATLVRNPANGKWGAQWQKPFIAEWRLAVSGKDAAYARTWNATDLGARGGRPLPVEEPFAQAPQCAVVYAWGRDAITAAEVRTPADILLDFLGVQGCVRALDVEGIQGYRSGDGSTPFRDLLLHDQSWHPARAVDEGDFGVIETMGSIFPVGTDGVRTFLTRLGGDALNLLQGLDTRVAEYEQYLQDVAAFCDAHVNDDRQGFLASVRLESQKLLQAGRDIPKGDIAGVNEALGKVLALVGTMDNVTLKMFQGFCELPGNEKWAATFADFQAYLAAQEGRVWYNGVIRFELWYQDDFEEFSARCRDFMTERQIILSLYRAWARRVRDAAARMVVGDPAFKPVGEEFREKARLILRNRYYLERDWRGETPLARGTLQ